MRSWTRAGSVEREGSAMLREARLVWKQRGGVSCSRLGCFRLGCPLLASVIGVFDRNLPHPRGHPGSSLLLYEGARRPDPARGSCVVQRSHLHHTVPVTGPANPPACARGRAGSGAPSPAVPGWPGSEKGSR